MKLPKILTLAAATWLASIPAFAVVVYNNGAPNQQNGNETAQWIQAEDFQLASASSVTSAQFWTVEGGAWDGTLNWWIFADNAGAPGAIVASGAGSGVSKVATGNVLGFGTEYVYDFGLAGVPVLASGTTYWFGLHLSSNYDRDEIYWETTSHNPPNGHESFEGTLNNWSNNGQDHAFNLSAGQGVPDTASTAILLGLALISLGFAKRRRS